MATTKSRYAGGVDTHRKSYILSIQPVELSLTDGTNIPAPSPPRTPGESPAPGGGPLSSHPPSTASTTATDKGNGVTTSNHDRTDRLRSTPMSPASATHTHTASISSPPPQPTKARGPGLRKLLSLNNLRSSFSASRTSLMLPRNSTQIDSATTANGGSGMKRPSSSSMISTSMMSTADSQFSSSGNTTRSRRMSGSWFKRRSSLFLGSDENGMVVGAGAGADQQEPARESKRRREYKAAPRLPQISELVGGTMNDGDLGWDETMFKK